MLFFRFYFVCWMVQNHLIPSSLPASSLSSLYMYRIVINVIIKESFFSEFCSIFFTPQPICPPSATLLSLRISRFSWKMWRNRKNHTYSIYCTEDLRRGRDERENLLNSVLCYTAVPEWVSSTAVVFVFVSVCLYGIPYTYAYT